MPSSIISADSHVVEPANAFIDRIDRKFKDRAPRLVHDEKRGDVFIVEGSSTRIPLALVSAAGKQPEELSAFGAVAEKLHKGGWHPDARLVDMDRDGLFAEVLYPSVGMELCNLPDMELKKACLDAYNLWIAEFSGAHPERLIGLGQTALRTPDEGIEDLRKIKELGLRGVMLPGFPGQEDYNSPIYGEFFEAAIALELPISFHILTSGEAASKTRGSQVNYFNSIIRANQDIMSMFVMDGVFMRHPKLRIVCVEADAGWVPHYIYRLDHAYKRHRFWTRGMELERMPSEYFLEHIYLTFQDDLMAFEFKDYMNVKRLMWASDYPHSDSTWPHSQDVIASHTKTLTEAERNAVLHDNVAELYGLTV